ncbi:protein LAZY 1-like [Typha latifolia]|uniref:protein LAZY 1-like n=1 Tax=Typha latifolia TaxID=4733 RepID=UPI003C2D54DD
MKLLGWMHRKFRQNNGDVFKDLASGGSCNCLPGRASLEVDDEEHHRHRRRQSDPFVSRCLRLSSEDLLDVACAGAGDSEAVDKIFGGLLAIGTLGVDSCPMDEEYLEEEKEEIDMDRDEAVTPRFGPIAEKAAAAAAAAENDLFAASADVEKVLAAEATTEEDLVVVSVELEKVLAAEAEKVTGGDRISSARPSAGDRISCPLQGFLFGSPIEMAETMGKREKRVSLGELFMRSKIAEEEEEGVDTGEGGGGGRGGEGKSTARMLKKMLKRRGFSGSGGGNGNNWTAESKFQKILKIFHRKVHPENTTATKKATKYKKHENEDYGPHRGDNGPLMTTSKLSYRRECMPSFKCCSDPTSLALGRSDSSDNREHWIKTDADYLVLEL